VKRHLGLLAEYFVQYAKVRLAYRGDFALSVVTMTMASVFGAAIVYLIFGRAPRLAGWSFHEILFLYGFSLLPLSLFNMVSINLYYFSDKYLIQGNFDRVLLRPVNSLFQILFEQFRLEALGDGMLGLTVMIVSARYLDQSFRLAEILFLGFAAICGAAIYVSVFLALTCVSFWMEDRIGVVPPVYNLLTFGRYPMDIYNGFIRIVLSWIVPFGFATFYPTASVLRGDAYTVYAWLLPLVTVVSIALSCWVWSRGVGNYSSTGS